MRSRDPEELVEAAVTGDRGALARLISTVERRGDDAREVSRLVYPLGADAYAVGVTGAPGAGKSTLTDRLVAAVRSTGDEVAVIAVDPSSPRTGGAILGDRVRMQEHALDPGVFVRSMGSRGDLGGLAIAAPESIRVLAAAGFPWVLVETVGVGQVEVDIAGAADTTIVVVNPGWGDAIQASKAGLLEIADVFAINKADRPGAAETQRDIESVTLDLDLHMGDWRPPVVRTVASTGEGVDELWQAVVDHRAHLEKSGVLAERRAERATDELRRVVGRALDERAQALLGADGVERLVADVVARTLDPYSAAEEILRHA